MRILNVSAQKPDSTGSGIYLSALVRSQLAAGLTPAVLCGAAPGDTQADIPPEVPVATVDFETPGLPFKICGMSDVMPYPSMRYRDLTPAMAAAFERAFAAAIDDAVDTFKPDLVLCHHLYLVTALVRERVHDVPVVAVCHSTDLRQLLTHDLECERILAGVRALDAVLSLHDDQAAEIVRVCGVDPARIHVVGTGYDHRIFHPDPATPRMPGALVYVGKVCIKKGVESLVHALGVLSPQAASMVELTLVGGHGDEGEFDEIERAAAQAPCPVEFAGRLSQEELVRAYRSSEVFVLPSFFEGLPLVSIEAVACGCKVVMTELPGVRPWMEAALPGAPVTWLAPPAMLDVDTPDPAALPAFEERLARAIETSLAAPTPVCDATGVSWDACSARILEVAKTLKGGIHG